MPAILISLLSKFGPYAAVALIALGLGAYAMDRWDQGEIATAKLALANQQLADTQATNAWNEKAAAFQAQISSLSNTVQAARQAQQQQDQLAVSTQEAALAKQAAQPGQDAPIAPILQAEHDNLEQMLQGAGQ
jgi:hypothetical protein